MAHRCSIYGRRARRRADYARAAAGQAPRHFANRRSAYWSVTRASIPQHAEGRITIAATEVLPGSSSATLMAALEAEAPQLQLLIFSMRTDGPLITLETGRSITVGGRLLPPDLPGGLSRRRLFRQVRHAGRRQAPQTDPPCRNIEQRTSSSPTGDFEGRVDTALRALGHRRRVVARDDKLPHQPGCCAKRDLVLTAPRLLLRATAPSFPAQAAALSRFSSAGIVFE